MLRLMFLVYFGMLHAYSVQAETQQQINRLSSIRIKETN